MDSPILARSTGHTWLLVASTVTSFAMNAVASIYLSGTADLICYFALAFQTVLLLIGNSTTEHVVPLKPRWMKMDTTGTSLQAPTILLLGFTYLLTYYVPSAISSYVRWHQDGWLEWNYRPRSAFAALTVLQVLISAAIFRKSMDNYQRKQDLATALAEHSDL